jgi:voltage-dependent potassium channel beta subunit
MIFHARIPARGAGMRAPAQTGGRVEYRRIGTSGLKASTVALGSWLTFGRSVDQPGTTRCVRRALELGVIFFDTADVYARGAAEVALGKALRDVNRRDYVLATKVFWPMSDNPNDRGLSRKHIIESCEASLQRLGVDYIDLYQCHRFDPDVQPEEVVRAMDTLIRQGKILYWGVSVWSSHQILDSVRLAEGFHAFAPISNQPPYNLLQREIERDVIPACKGAGLGQVVFSPLAEGILTGKYAGGRVPKGSRAADPKTRTFLDPLLTAENLARVERMASLARELDVTPAALAIAWTLREPNVASAITGATAVEQIEENVLASDLKIPPEIADRIEALFPRPD